MSSTSSLSFTPSESRPVDWGRFVLVGLGTVIVAVLTNVLVYFIGRVVVGYDPEFVVLRNVSAVILFTVVPAIVAVLLYAALLRFTANPARTFTIIAAVVLVVSLIPDVAYIPTVPGATGGQTGVLAVMHVVAAVVIVVMLTTLTRPQPRSRDF
jgi:Family of unknown function (DUF6069)